MDGVEPISEDQLVAKLRHIYTQDTSVASTRLLADILGNIDTNWPPKTLPFRTHAEVQDISRVRDNVLELNSVGQGLPYLTNFAASVVLLSYGSGTDIDFDRVENKSMAETLHSMLDVGCYEAVKWCMDASRLDVATSRSVPSAECVLTNHIFSNPALIIPVSTKAPYPAFALKNVLKFASFFWGLEDVDEYDKILKDMDLMASPKNKLFLDPYMHAMWAAGKFGLKPLPRTDGDSYSK